MLHLTSQPKARFLGNPPPFLAFLVFATQVGIAQFVLAILIGSVQAQSLESPLFGDHSPQATQVSDGNPVELEELGISVTPLAGWEYLTRANGVSLLIKAPTKSIVDTASKDSKWLFRRNFTVVAMHDPSPIDDREAKVLKQKIKESIQKATGVDDVIMEDKHQLIDMSESSKGLVIYSHFQYNELMMAQVHLVVSGESKRFLLTYTDLAEELQKDGVFDEAWKVLSSIKVTGKAPARFASVEKIGMVIGGLLAMLIGFILMRYLRSYLLLKNAELELGNIETNSSIDFDGVDIEMTEDLEGFDHHSSLVAPKRESQATTSQDDDLSGDSTDWKSQPQSSWVTF